MPQTRVNATAADAMRDRYGAFFANAFAPQFRYSRANAGRGRTYRLCGRVYRVSAWADRRETGTPYRNHGAGK